jgi:polyhydroxyalkanoate synthase
MNTPDAASWMSQFADPNAWQAWMKLPEAGASGFNAMGAAAGNPANLIASLLGDAGAGLAPAKLDALRNDYLQKAAALWQDVMSGKTPAFADKRFAAPAWSANPMTAFSVASYLLNAEFMMALADAVDVGQRDKQKIRFAVQQMVDALSPANFLATNPDAQQKMLETKGESLTRGLQNMLADMQKGRISQSDESSKSAATSPSRPARWCSRTTCSS